MRFYEWRWLNCYISPSIFSNFLLTSSRNRGIIVKQSRAIVTIGNAGVAELADAQASGACGRKIVWVQVPSPAFFFILRNADRYFFQFSLDFCQNLRYYSQAVMSDCNNRKCRSGGIGRRAGFRCLWSQDRVGSSPISCILFLFYGKDLPRLSKKLQRIEIL